MSQVHQVVIIGSGPAGYTAAIYAARANLSPIVFEGEPSMESPDLLPGGQLMLTTEVENYPGFPDGITGPDMMAKFKAQAERFGARCEMMNVEEVDLQANPKRLRTSDGNWHEAHAVIISTGASARWLGLESETALRNRGVSACAVCDGALPMFRNRPMAVVGGGDSAMEEAMYLTKFGSKVYLVVRRDELRASKIMAQRAMNNPKIEFLYSHSVTAALGGDGLEQIRVKDLKTDEEREIECFGLFFAIGHIPNTGFLDGQIETDEQGYIITKPDSTATNVPGVFAAGDVQDKKYRQAITAAGTGCMAAIEAEHFLAAQE